MYLLSGTRILSHIPPSRVSHGTATSVGPFFNCLVGHLTLNTIPLKYIEVRDALKTSRVQFREDRSEIFLINCRPAKQTALNRGSGVAGLSESGRAESCSRPLTVVLHHQRSPVRLRQRASMKEGHFSAERQSDWKAPSLEKTRKKEE